MRVLLICGAGIVSGKEIMSLHLLRELKKKGYDCFCIVATWGSDDFRNRLNEIGVPFYNLRLGFISKTLNWSAIRMTLVQAFYLPGLLVKYLFLTRRLRPDVIIHTNFHHAFLLYPVMEKKHNIYWSHEILSATSFYRRLFQLFDKKMDKFVSVSDAVAVSLRQLIGNQKVGVVRNGTTLVTLAPVKKLNNSKLAIGIIGQVSRHKGHEILLEALSHIKENTFSLHIIGHGTLSYENHLRKLIEKYGLTDQVTWRGFIKDPNEIYAGIDLVIVPSIFPDPFPTIVMEAGMRGIPVIASTIGGLSEMVVNDVNGFLIEPDSPEMLTASIRRIIEYPEFFELRKRTLLYAKEHFRIDAFADNFEVIIKEVL